MSYQKLPAEIEDDLDLEQDDGELMEHASFAAPPQAASYAPVSQKANDSPSLSMQDEDEFLPRGRQSGKHAARIVSGGSALARLAETYAVPFWITLSIASSVSIILINKYLMSTYNFHFPLSLTACHFVFQAVFMELSALRGDFERQPIPFRERMIMSAMSVGSVGFMNINLKVNSVGMYQVSKLLCIPAMVFIQSMFMGQTFSSKIKATLAVIILGVGVATVTDLSVTSFGVLMAALAVFFTAEFQILVGDFQNRLQVKPVSFTHAFSAPQAVLMVVVALVVESQGADNILEHQVSTPEVVLLLASCATAIFVNIGSTGLIGKTSPVTYQVVGHAKTCLILVAGYVLFPSQDDAASVLKNLFGVVVAMSGVIVYTHLKTSRPAGQPDWCDQVASALRLR